MTEERWEEAERQGDRTRGRNMSLKKKTNINKPWTDLAETSW